jgi:hypothetical protein
MYAVHVILQVFSNYQAIASRTFTVSLIMEFVVSSSSGISMRKRRRSVPG